MTSTFNWQIEKNVPTDIFQRLTDQNIIGDGLNGWYRQDLDTVFFLPSALRCHLVNNLGYKDSDRVISYRVDSQGNSITFDHNTGQRLGDDIDFNCWITKR